MSGLSCDDRAVTQRPRDLRDSVDDRDELLHGRGFCGRVDLDRVFDTGGRPGLGEASACTHPDSLHRNAQSGRLPVHIVENAGRHGGMEKMRPRERDRQIHPTRRPTVVEVHGVAFSGIRTQASCRARNFELTHGVYRASAPTATATNSRRQSGTFAIAYDAVMRGDEERVIQAFCAFLDDQGWSVQREVDFVDVVASKEGHVIFAEVKGRTAAIGLDVDTMFGQLLRRMPLERPDGDGVRFAVVVPTEATAAVQRVPAWVRQDLCIDVYIVGRDGSVTSQPA